MSAENIIFVLVEGKHDSAVLNRLLKINGFKNFSDKKISEFNDSLRGYFQKKIKDFTYEDESNLWQRPQLPNYIRYQDDTWFLFYQMDGDTQTESTVSLLKPFKKEISNIESNFSFSAKQPKISLLFFYDADSSVAYRKREFVKQYADYIPSFTDIVNENIDNEQVSFFQLENKDGFDKLGLFVYGVKGTLEDLVVPLMKEGNEDLFASAENHMNTYLKKGNLNKSYKKGLIGTVGQTEKPGKSNQVILSDTTLLNKSKLDNDPVFQEILILFKKYAK